MSKLRKVRIKQLQDEKIKAYAVSDVKLSKEVGAGKVEDYFAGIARYLEVNGKCKCPILGQTTNPASKVS